MVALVLASVSLYATLSHSVSRVQEISIRVAIGATPRDVLALLYRQAVFPVALGLSIGSIASFAVLRLVRSQLVGVSPADPITFLLASAVLVAAAALGCLLPARRATHVDPVVALRHE